MPENFITSFVFDYYKEPIHVSKRPFVEDCLLRMADLYEIVVFTAGV
jgi:TFIIF-interacting CTD phosphatase-like protein